MEEEEEEKEEDNLQSKWAATEGYSVSGGNGTGPYISR